MSFHAHSAHAHLHRHSFHSKREAPAVNNMAPLQRLVVRNNSQQSTTLTPTMVNLLIALLVLVLFGIVLIVALMVLRSRRSRQHLLEQEQSEKLSESNGGYSRTSPRSSHKPNHRRLTVTAAPYSRNSKTIYSYSEKEILMGESSPTSPIPEIRITFPEEEDEMGKRKSGRVVVVSVSDMGGVGLQPLRDEKEGLPAYEGPDWKELDLEQMGGLKEVERRS